jgi:hypothetical protein
MNNDDGGPAFPQMSAAWDDDKHEYVLSENLDGMSLRDWFAGKAMAAFLSMSGDIYVSQSTNEHIAATSYAMADAMLKARNA